MHADEIVQRAITRQNAKKVLAIRPPKDLRPTKLSSRTLIGLMHDRLWSEKNRFRTFHHWVAYLEHRNSTGVTSGSKSD